MTEVAGSGQTAPLETRRRLQAISAENLRAFLAGKPQNVVNP